MKDGVKSFDTLIELDARVEYVYHKGTKEYFDSSMGNWHPGDPPTIEHDSAFILVSVKALKTALQQAEKDGKTNDRDMVEIDVIGSLSVPEADSIVDQILDEESKR